MSGKEAGDFITLALVLVVVAVGAGLCVAVPWLAAAVAIGLVAWLARGWVKDEREFRA